MRFAAVRGRWSPAVAAAFLVAASACSPQCGVATKPSSTPLAASSTAPSPSPTSTTPLHIAAATFHPGEVGATYQAVGVAATGGVAPYTWSIASGELPDGVTLGSDGSVSGIPTSAGSFSFTIQVADSRGGSAALPGSISVAPQLSASLIPACSRACQVEAGCVDVCGAFGSLAGGTGPYSYSANGYIPPTTHLYGLSYAGTFTRPISYWQSTVTVTDSFGETASLSPLFNVFAHVSLAGGVCAGDYSSGCSVSLPISGGHGHFAVELVAAAPNPNPVSPTGGTCWDTSSGTPPPGYTLSVSGSSVVVTIPSRLINGYGGIWTLVVTDQSLCAANTYCGSAAATVRIGVQCG